MVATYVGVALYAVLYLGYTLWERFFIPASRRPQHYFIPLAEVDLDSDAVWRKGEGDAVREREREKEKERDALEGERYGAWRWLRRAGRHVY